MYFSYFSKENLLAGVCKKSILAQRKSIFMLEIQIDCLEYRLQHNIIHKL